ncbi:MAG: hypothetical protein ABSH38_14335 [Verrucomicrobiota bacterium]
MGEEDKLLGRPSAPDAQATSGPSSTAPPAPPTTPAPTAPAPNNSPEPQGERTTPGTGLGPYTRDLLFAVISALVAQGYAMSGLESSIVGACICWGAALCFASHAIWIWLRIKRVNIGIRIFAIIAIWGSISMLSRHGIAGQYRKQHSPPPISAGEKKLMERIDVQDMLISNLSATEQGIRDAIANNPLASPDLRNNVIDVDRRLQDIKSESTNLKTWEEGMIGKYRDKRATIQLDHDKQIRTFHFNHQEHVAAFQYAITALNTAMDNVAKLKMDSLEENYHGLPLVIDWETETNIAVEELNLRTNVNWKFSVIFHSNFRNMEDVLTISCDVGSVGVDGSSGWQDVFTRINGIAPEKVGPGDKYKKAIDDAVTALIGAELNRDRTITK